MGTVETLSELIDGAYAAALDGDLWASWACRLTEALGGVGSTFVVLDTTTGAIERMVWFGEPNDDEVQYYKSSMAAYDPQIPHAASLKRSGFYLDTDIVDYTDPQTREFMSWVTSNVGWEHHMTMVAKLNNGRIHAGVSMHRGVGDGATPIEEQEKLAAILPEITRAMSLGFRHGEKLVDSYWNGVERGEPALLLDERGRVMRSTPSMDTLIANMDGLDVSGGMPRANDSATNEQLWAAIRRTIASDRRRSSAVRVPRRSGRSPYIVTLYPLPRRFHLLPPAEASVLMTVIDPINRPGGEASVYQQAFGFTPRESDFAMLLTGGHSIESAATVMCISLPTARLYLRRLLHKAGVTRQIDLVRLLVRIR